MQDDKSKNSSIFNNVWPQERDVISRPDRLRYVRGLKTETQGCVFCEILQRGEFSAESLLLFKSKHSMVVMNKYPYNPAHLLVLPLIHEGDLTALNFEVLSDLAVNVQRCVRILKAEYSCAGLNIGLNHGQVAGAGIPGHLHWHIIPRWAGDTNFFPLIAETKVHPETMEETYKRLKPHFDKEESAT
ncbi:MAG: HIT domain-containing protein [Bdellovibrionaceae bacterium]|nr:HIT domain-containing protein [Pseudobdellovibrionaceae bacterium]